MTHRPAAGAGRPRPTIGIDIGGTQVRTAVVDDEGRILTERCAPTPRSAAALDDLLLATIDEVAADHEPASVGLAVAGFVSADRARVMFAPHLPWRDAAVPEVLSRRTGLPVVMDHDVNCAAWVEYHRGAAAGIDPSLTVSVGTGIGSGFITGGEIFRGAFGVAPEIGHVVVVPGGRPCPCGKRGCWERYCSGTALVDTVLEAVAAGEPTSLREPGGRGPGPELTGAAVATAARAGDRLAAAAMTDLGRWLGVGLAVACDVLDPAIVVLSGGVSASAGMFLDTARATLATHLTGAGARPEPRLVVARFGAEASAVGAALLAAAAAG